MIKPLPSPAAHARMSELNRTGRGIRTIVTCSCGWRPSRAPESGSSRSRAWETHRRSAGVPVTDHDRGTEVFGEGPWAGWTWDEWYEVHGGRDIDPYTGVARVF